MELVDRQNFRKSLIPVVPFILLIWVLKAIEVGLDIDFSIYGNYPRTLSGSLGIITSPLIHADLAHLLSNSFPLLFLGVGIFFFYRSIAWPVVVIIYLLSGFWVWLVAREAYHIGASGIVYGFMAFLLLGGFLRRDKSSLAISFVVLVLYGGSIFTGVLPSQPGVSWESHLVGAIAGLFCAIYFRNEPIYGAHENLADAEENTSSQIFHYTYLTSSRKKANVQNYEYSVSVDQPDKKDRSHD